MKKFSFVELLRDIETVAMAADREPVAITQHEIPRYVLMSCDTFEAMKRRADPRRVFAMGEPSQDLVDLILPELDRLIAEGREADD